ncbi:MAG: Ig-like domain-containing protein [Bacteroidales bacterium]|nr:Ig-like domain-containing protein [Bacteroidales bacterium]
MLTVTVTYQKGLRNPNLSFSTTAFTICKYDDITAPTLNYATGFDGTVTYSSDNEDVAYVDNEGEVYIGVSTGTATITAQSAATDNFYAGSASYTITVLPYFSGGLAELKAQIIEDAGAAEYYVYLSSTVVTYVNDAYAYLEDLDKGIGLVYYKEDGDHVLEAGDRLIDKVKVSTMVYNGLAEITSLEFTEEGQIYLKNADVPVTGATIAQLNASPDTYDSRRVKIIGATVTTPQSEESNEAVLTLGGSTIKAYSTLPLDHLSTAGNVVDVIGYLYTYGTELYFRVWEDPTGKTNPALSFSATTATVNNGDTFTAPELTNPNSMTVTYSSSNEAVATVDASTGEVTIVGIGTTVITASSEATDDYLAGEASYTLTVVDPNGVYYYKKVTRQDDIVAGGVYLIASPDVDYFAGAQSTTSTKYRTIVDATTASTTLMGGLLQISQTGVNATGMPYEVTLVESETAGEYKLQILGSDGTTAYLVHNSSSNDVKEDDSSDADGSLWKLTYDETKGTVSVQNTTQYAKSGTLSDWYLQYNSNKNQQRFATYTNSMKDPVLYRRVEAGQLTIVAEEGYATYFTDKNFEMPVGVTGTTITGVDNGNLNAAWGYTEGAEVPAETALLVKGTPGTYYYAILDNVTATKPEGNLLNGYTTDTPITADDTKNFYKLTYSNDGSAFGFYWGAENGGAFTCKANKAYLELDKTQSAQANGFSFGDNGEITSITGVKQSQSAADAAVYSLKGVRLNGNLDSQTKGLYIVNGKKVLVK